MRDEQGGEERGDGAPASADEEGAMGEALRDLREDGPNGRPGTSFDPTPYLRQLRGRGGGQDYLDVKWRLLWLRREYPDAEIVTEHVQIDPTIAIFKATVTLPTGGKATGYGSETAGDFGDFIEKAETKAIGRALNALGYGAQFGERGDDLDPAPSPPSGGSPPAPPPPPLDFAAGRERTAQRPAEPPPERPAPTETSPSRGRSRSAPAAATAAPATAAEAEPGPEPDLADYSWSAFWPWARGLGLNGPKAVEDLIGRPTAGLTPAELRDLILAARDNP